MWQTKSSWLSAALIALLAVVFIPADSQAQSAQVVSQAQSAPDSTIIRVKMIDRGGGQWRFEPADITVQRGDVVQFVQEDVIPHNVEFKKTPRGTHLGDDAVGRFLMKKGATYDVVIDERFATGKHAYICTPHEAMGMKGTITIKKDAE